MSTTSLMTLLIRWLMLSLAVWVAAIIVPGIHLEGWQSTLIVAAILGLLNTYVKPILFLLSLPFTIITLGLFLVVLNALMLGLADLVANISSDIRFDVDGIWAAIFGALIISFVNVVLSIFIKPDRIARSLTGGY